MTPSQSPASSEWCCGPSLLHWEKILVRSWLREKLIVEVDGYAYHSSMRAFERDRERDAQLAARGHTVIRVTWRQLRDGPEAVVARIAAALVVRSR